MNKDSLKFLVEQAIKAPSSHNTQPWKFSINDNQLFVWADMQRRLLQADPTNRELYTSIGCAIGNIKLAAEAKGWNLSVEYVPQNPENLIAIIKIISVTKNQNEKSILEAISKRVNNRLPYNQQKSISENLIKQWKNSANSYGIVLNIEIKKVVVSKLADFTYEGIKAALGKTEFRQELSSWLRHNWTKQKDGLPGYTIGMPDIVSIMSPILIRSEDVVEPTAKGEKEMVEKSYGIGVISAESDEISSWIKVGEIYEKIAVEASAKGIATAVLSGAVEVEEQRIKLKKLLDLKGLPALFFRIGYPTQTARSAPRRGTDEVLIDHQEITSPFFKIEEKFNRKTGEERELVNWYLSYKINDYSKLLQDKKEEYWQKLGEKRAIQLFKQAARDVPAYKDFLAKNKVDPGKINTIEDFKTVPVIDKKNYISQYPIESLCWGGKLPNNHMLSFSSGSTGKPYFWPRGIYQEIEGALFHEHLLVNTFEVDKYSTLVIVAFSMGSYVAGTYTASSIRWVASKGYNMTIATPGIDHNEVLRVINEMGDKFQQIVICGYPPFIKDLLEKGKISGTKFSKNKIRFLLASEFFSEKWREVLLEEVGNKKDGLIDSTNIYGAADATLFGFETPETILLRKYAYGNSSLQQALFGSDLTPTIVQYNPAMRFFEVGVENELILTAAAGIPLIRYNLHDKGGILSVEKRRTLLSKFGYDWQKDLNTQNALDKINNLPTVYLVGRTDGAVSLYGVLIYPDYIKGALEDDKLINQFSGKFTMLTKYNRQHDQYLELNMELKIGIKASSDLQKLAEDVIRQKLKKSTEYIKLEEAIREKAKPKVILYEKGDSNYFVGGIKQRWIKATN